MATPTKHLVRSRTDRVIAGVCGGLAEYFHIDATVIRLLFVVVAFAGGSSAFIYILLWVLMPNEGEESLPLESKERWDKFGSEVRTEAHHFAAEFRNEGGGQTGSWGDRRTLFAVIIVLLGVVLLLRQFIPFTWFRAELLWPFLLIVIGVIILKRR